MAGILYIKINRYDSSSINNTNILQQLNNIKINYNDIGLQNYSILSITEFPTYYLYLVEPQSSISSSTDNTILNLNLRASTNFLPISSSNGITLPFLSPSSDTLSWFNSSSGEYTIEKTSNIPIQFTASIRLNNSGPSPETVNQIYLINTRNNNLISTTTSSISVPAGGTRAVTLQNIYSPLETDIIKPVIFSSGPNLTAQIALTYTQSISPTSSIYDQIIFEPNIDESYEYSDYNPLIDNVEINQYSQYYMDIDYSQGINIPVNFNQLINNTATRANIQDYYYVYKRHINPRYEGSKVYAANFNYYTPLTNNATFADGETQQNWNGDTIPGEITVGNPLTYFAYFDWIGGTPNEYFNGSGVKLKFLINEKGETFPPSLSSPYYYNLIGSFEQNTTAIISQINTTPGQPNNTEWPILYPGKSPYPIIYSQTGSTYTTYPTLSFFPGNDISIPNYEFNVLKTTPQAIFSPSANSFPGIAIGFDTSPVTPSSNILWNSAFEYITASSATNTQIKINSSLTFKNNNYEFNPGVLPVNIVLQIQSCPTFGFSQSTTTVVSQLNFTLNNLLEVTKNISSDYFYPTSGTFYRIAIYWNSNSPGVDFEITEGSLYITQNPSSNLDILLGSGYFSTGSSSKNWLTGSISFTQNIYGRKQISIPNSGYFDPLPFDIKVGDYIRFEADENKTYYIKSILPPSDPLSNGILKIELDKEIQTNTDINSFLIRRWENDPSFIILNNVNASNIEGPGIIYPKYLSQDIKNKIPSIIQDLSNKGLI